MSMTKLCLDSETSPLSGPVGFGASKVPCSVQYACQRASISRASAAP
jgi:hypothetical protein